MDRTAMDWPHEVTGAIEKKVFDQGATLLNLEVDLLFFDTTSTCRAFGESKGHRCDPRVGISVRVGARGFVSEMNRRYLRTGNITTSSGRKLRSASAEAKAALSGPGTTPRWPTIRPSWCTTWTTTAGPKWR
ncbi:hypothetical protein ACFWYW_49475 [Nonomuraea sp. NPDC059023]|uniref:hypothetical protein n=1 Tax=unclassified Nonomuraea TaxID=2593643 RepID=UPI003683D379